MEDRFPNRNKRGMWVDPTMTKEDATAIAKGIGSLGGKAGTEKQNAARRQNGTLGGRPEGTVRLRKLALALAGWPPDLELLRRVLEAADEILPEGRATRGWLSRAQATALRSKVVDSGPR